MGLRGRSLTGEEDAAGGTSLSSLLRSPTPRDTTRPACRMYYEWRLYIVAGGLWLAEKPQHLPRGGGSGGAATGCLNCLFMVESPLFCVEFQVVIALAAVRMNVVGRRLF